MKYIKVLSIRSLFLSIALAFAAATMMTACHDPGPAEEAGREVDEAIEDARDAVEDLGDEAEEALEELQEDR
jgi:hypothetical protein